MAIVPKSKYQGGQRIGGVNVRKAQVKSVPTSSNQTINTNENMFGGIQAKQAAISARRMSAMGGFASSMMGQIGGIIEKQEIEHDNAVVDQADFEFSTKALELQRSFSQLQGNDAISAQEQYLEQMEALRKERESALSNDRQRNLFRRRALSTTKQFHNSIYSHYSAENKKYQAQQRLSVIGIKSEAAAEAFANGDTESANIALGESLAAIREDVDKTGAPPETFILRKQQAIDGVITKAVKTLLAGGDVPKAMALFKQHEAELSEKTRAAILGPLKQEEDRLRWNAAAMGVMTEHLSPQEAEKYVRENFRGEDRAEIGKRVRQQYAAARKARKAQQEDVEAQAWEHIRQGGTSDTMPAALRNSVNPKTLTQMDETAAKMQEGKFATDPLAHIEVYEKIEAGVITDERQIVAEYGGRLSRQHMQEAIKQVRGKEEVKDSALKEVFTEYGGLSGKKWQEDKKHRESWIAFNDYVRAKVRENKQGSEEDIRNYAHQWFMKGYTGGRRGLLDITAGDTTFGEAVMSGDANKFLIDTPADEEQAVNRVMEMVGAPVNGGPTVQDAFYTRYYTPTISMLKKLGMTPTPSLVAKAIKRKIEVEKK